MSDLQQRYAQIQKALNHGCHDRACVIEKTTGMVTNGGCDCLRDLSFVDRQRVGQLLLLGQEAIAQLAAAEAEIQELVLELLAAQGQAADALNDKLAAMERVREAILTELVANMVWMPKSRRTQAKVAIRALDLDALAEGDG